MATSGIVVSHGHARELESSLPALAPQVDELLVVANIPGSLPAELQGARVIENERPRSYSANLNAAFARTYGEFVVVCNPDAVAEPEAVQVLASFADAHPRCGVAGPQMLDPDGRWQPSRRRFPTVMGTLVRRTPLRRRGNGRRARRQSHSVQAACRVTAPLRSGPLFRTPPQRPSLPQWCS